MRGPQLGCLSACVLALSVCLFARLLDCLFACDPPSRPTQLARALRAPNCVFVGRHVRSPSPPPPPPLIFKKKKTEPQGGRARCQAERRGAAARGDCAHVAAAARRHALRRSHLGAGRRNRSQHRGGAPGREPEPHVRGGGAPARVGGPRRLHLGHEARRGEAPRRRRLHEELSLPVGLYGAQALTDGF